MAGSVARWVGSWKICSMEISVHLGPHLSRLIRCIQYSHTHIHTNANIEVLYEELRHSTTKSCNPMIRRHLPHWYRRLHWNSIACSISRASRTCPMFFRCVLGGSWIVISGVISPLICIVTLLITPFTTTHEPPSRNSKKTACGEGCRTSTRSETA